MPVPAGYVLDKPQAQSVNVPKGYVLDQPAQPKPAVVQPKADPGASISASPSWSDQLTALLHHPLNTLDNLAQPVSRPNNASVPEMASADLQNVASGGFQAIRHPLDTIAGGISSFFHPKQTFDAMNENGPQIGAQMIGNSAVMGAAGELGGKSAGRVLQTVGDKAQDAGAGVMNRTVGSLQRDFKRGANPGKAYLQAGGGPALSMDSLAGKASDLKGETGQKIGNLYSDATAAGTKISPQTVGNAIQRPISAARDAINGPGGSLDTTSLDNFQRSFAPSFEGAVKNGGFTPDDLFGMKKSVSNNTSWSDPTQIGLKKTAQQTAGAIGGTLEDAVPGVKDLNAQYQGLTNFSTRAASRAATHSSPLTSLFGRALLGGGGALLGGELAHNPIGGVVGALGGAAMDSVPVKSTVAAGLYRGGRGAVAIGKGLQSLF